MIRIPFAVAVGLTTAMLFGCAQQPKPQPQTVTGPSCVINGKTTAFLDHVYILANYNPNGGNYQPPSGTPSSQWPSSTQSIQSDLETAFQNAPSFFQTHLCTLKAIFINASGCNNNNSTNDPSECTLANAGAMFVGGSWGFRSHANGATDLGDTYIAISAADLWPTRDKYGNPAGGNSARKLDDYETQLMQSLPGVRSGSHVDPNNTRRNDSWMSVLAALAHETGHVLWVTTTIPQPGGDYDFSTLISCSNGIIFSGWKFNKLDVSHKDLRPLDPLTKNRWRDFPDPMNTANGRANEGGPPLEHRTTPKLSALDSSNASTANQALSALLQSKQPWASLFGAQAPDEDFVETYVMAVLTGYDRGTGTFAGPLTNLPVVISGSETHPDVPNDLRTGKMDLRSKIACVANLPLPPSP